MLTWVTTECSVPNALRASDPTWAAGARVRVSMSIRVSLLQCKVPRNYFEPQFG